MPYVARPYLDDPADIQVWRYMNIEKLLSILVDQALFFASTRTIASDDWFEGQFTTDELAALVSIPLSSRKSTRNITRPFFTVIFQLLAYEI